MKCPLGFSNADPSVDSSDRYLTGQQLVALLLQLTRGISSLFPKDDTIPQWQSDLCIPKPFPAISTASRKSGDLSWVFHHLEPHLAYVIHFLWSAQDTVKATTVKVPLEEEKCLQS